MTSEVQNRLHTFLSDLTEKTASKKICWHRLSEYDDLHYLLLNIQNTPGLYVDFFTNSVVPQDSFFVSTSKGDLFLLYIAHASGQLYGEYFMLALLKNQTEFTYLDFGEVFHKVISSNLHHLAELISKGMEDELQYPENLYALLNEVLK